MNESLFDRLARALGNVPITNRGGVNVYLGPPHRGDMAEAALAVVKAELDRLRARIAELEGLSSNRVLPAKFVTDAMAGIPDELPPDFS